MLYNHQLQAVLQTKSIDDLETKICSHLIAKFSQRFRCGATDLDCAKVFTIHLAR